MTTLSSNWRAMARRIRRDAELADRDRDAAFRAMANRKDRSGNYAIAWIEPLTACNRCSRAFSLLSAVRTGERAEVNKKAAAWRSLARNAIHLSRV